MKIINPNLLESIKNNLLSLGKVIYRHPMWAMLVLSLLSNLYLIADFGVINRSSLQAIWLLENTQGKEVSSLGSLGHLMWFIHQYFGLSVIASGHLIMVFCFTAITVVLMAMARFLSFSLISQWALIFLLLSHPSFNDFRSYIIVEPLFWLCLLVALYILFRFHRSHSLFAIFSWLMILLLASRLSVAAWFWLLLFPFGALFWKPWRRKSVGYALLAYALIVGVLMVLPIYYGVSPFQWLKESILSNPEILSQVLSLENNWTQEEDGFMKGVFVFSGASSLIIVRLLISFGIVCAFLVVYSITRKQYKMIKADYLRIIAYAILFDVAISVVLFVLSKDSSSILSFSPSLLLMLLAAQGLSYVFKKMNIGAYSSHKVLVIVWCLVAYFASGFIIFGPKKVYLRLAGGASVAEQSNLPIYANSDYYLFYAKADMKNYLSPESAIYQSHYKKIQYAYSKNRHHSIPEVLLPYRPIKQFSNRHGDTIFIYHLGQAENKNITKHSGMN